MRLPTGGEEHDAPPAVRRGVRARRRDAELYAGILVFATLGAYSLHQSWVDLLTLYIFGLLGFAVRRWDIPVAPAIIGLILGPLAETQFRHALAISEGDPSVFVTQPISASLLLLDALAVFGPWAWGRAMRR